MISDMDARIAIYDRSETQVFFPSRKYAEDVFYSIEFQQPPDWSINPEIALRGSEPGYRSGRSTVAIVKRNTKWAENNPTRFKFKIERSYLLNQYVGGQGVEIDGWFIIAVTTSQLYWMGLIAAVGIVWTTLVI